LRRSSNDQTACAEKRKTLLDDLDDLDRLFVSENNQNFGPSTMFCIHKLTELSVSFEVLDQQSAPNETFPIAQDATVSFSENLQRLGGLRHGKNCARRSKSGALQLKIKVPARTEFSETIEPQKTPQPATGQTPLRVHGPSVAGAG
jgi:hypothetical protein